jgi:hypothetical protein
MTDQQADYGIDCLKMYADFLNGIGNKKVDETFDSNARFKPSCDLPLFR